MREISTKLQTLASEAIDLALDFFSAGEQNPFILLVDELSKNTFIDVKDVEGNVSVQLVDMAKQIVSKVSVRSTQRYVIAYDSYVTMDGVRTDAVIVEAADRGDPDAFLIAQRYRVKKRSKKPEKIGSPVIIGSAGQLLS